MKIAFGCILILVVALLVDESQCWFGRRRRRRSGGRWSVSKGGITYTFKNGVSVTGYGSLKPRGGGVRVSIPLGRRRRAAEDMESQATITTMEPRQQTTTTTASTETEDCNECLKVQKYKSKHIPDDKISMNDNSFSAIVKFIEENKSAVKMEDDIKFTVAVVTNSPNKNIQPNQTLTISSKMDKCFCQTTLEPGYYMVTGFYDKQNKLVLSNTLMQFEKGFLKVLVKLHQQFSD